MSVLQVSVTFLFRDQPLSGYDERTIVLTLPDDLTVFDIDYLSIWSETLMVSFGHIMIPPDLDPQSVPVALFTSKVRILYLIHLSVVSAWLVYVTNCN